MNSVFLACFRTFSGWHETCRCKALKGEARAFQKTFLFQQISAEIVFCSFIQQKNNRCHWNQKLLLHERRIIEWFKLDGLQKENFLKTSFSDWKTPILGHILAVGITLQVSIITGNKLKFIRTKLCSSKSCEGLLRSTSVANSTISKWQSSNFYVVSAKKYAAKCFRPNLWFLKSFRIQFEEYFPIGWVDIEIQTFFQLFSGQTPANLREKTLQKTENYRFEFFWEMLPTTGVTPKMSNGTDRSFFAGE